MDTLNEVFTAWQEQAEQLLPEFDFYRLPSGNCIARNGYKITGEVGEAGKVYYYANRPNMLKDWTRGPVGILQYIQDRQNLNSRGDAFKFMAAAVGVTLDTFRTEEDRQRYEAKLRQYELREAALQFFMDQLHTNSTPQAEAVRQYLKGRGYKGADLRNPEADADADAVSMEIGYFAGLEDLRQYLTSAGYTDDEVTQTVSANLPHEVSRGTHPVVIPYRNPAGNLLGFVYRSTLPDVDRKYLIEKGIQRGAQLFNFLQRRKAQDLVITEGLMDALIATARGVPNVTALVGVQITEEQARQALRNSGRITLCLDADDAGRKGTAAAVDKLLQIAKEEDVPLRLFIAQLPAGYKDADELITKEGADAFRKVIAEAQTFIYYLQDQLLQPYADKSALTEKEQDELLRSIEHTAARLQTPTDRSLFTTYLARHFEGVVTPEALQQTAEALAYDADRQRQQEALAKQLKAAQKSLEGGAEPEDVLKKLEAEAERLKVTRGGNLLQAYGYEDLVKDVLNRKEGLKTGYKQLDAFMKFKRGAVSLIGGRTSHGKTTLMWNMALRMLKEYPALRFYFLSYEETKDRLLIKIAASLTEQAVDVLLPEYYDIPDHADKLEAYLRELRRRNRKPVPEIDRAFSYLDELLRSGRLTVTDRKYYVEELEALVKSEHKKHGNLGAFFIDYATKIKSLKMQDQYADIRREVIHVTETLEEIAKQTDTALIVGAQYGRTAAAKGNKAEQLEERPRLEHLKESGALEEISNIVLGIYNAEAEKTDGWKSPRDAGPITLEVQLLKNRDGKRNKTFTLLFQEDRRQIEDATPEQVTRLQEEKERRRMAKEQEPLEEKLKKLKAKA